MEGKVELYRDLNGESGEVNAGADHPLVVVGIYAHSVRLQVKRVLTILHLNRQVSTSVSVRTARSKICVNLLVPEPRFNCVFFRNFFWQKNRYNSRTLRPKLIWFFPQVADFMSYLCVNNRVS
jgi:hypothetical protein